MADIDRVIQWKLPATFSQFVQRAGRAARGRERTGVAILLVERSAYNTNLVNDFSMPPPSNRRFKAVPTKKITASGKKDAKETREYAIAHGVNRGSSRRLDGPPTGEQPRIDLDRADESLLTFVQSTRICRRRIWAEVFESPASEICKCQSTHSATTVTNA